MPLVQSPRVIVIKIILVAALAEFAVMFALPHLLPADTGIGAAAFIDAGCMALVISPFLWWTIVQPLRRNAALSLKKVEDVLTHRENRLRAIIETVPECVLLLSADGRIEEINPSGLLLLEADSAAGVTGTSLFSAVAPECRDAVTALVARVFRGENDSLECELSGFHGARRWIEIRAVPLRDADSAIIAALCIIQDTTERKQLEARMRHAQKMESIGTLSGGVAHDFNNILTAIIGYTNILKLKLAADASVRTYVDQILASAERATSLTQSLLTFSRKTAAVMKPVSINEAVQRTEQLLRPLIGDSVDLRIVPVFHDTTVLADASQLDQVMMNLATNARDAMPDGGTLTISTAVEDIGSDFIRANGFGKQGTYVVIRVSDTGMGMDRKTTERIFEPFFTTKEVGKGTGLGLSIVYGIVKSHNGFITCCSEPGQGATFTVYLPHCRAQLVEPELKQAPVPHGGTETIMIAEDDTDVRTLTRTLLENFGYTILEAEDGDAAIKRFREYTGTVNLLLLDVVMPKKNGRQVYEAVRDVAPGIKALFLSGYSEAFLVEKGMIEAGCAIVPKPVSPETLLKKVREVLDR